jgi:hypothetical protein
MNHIGVMRAGNVNGKARLKFSYFLNTFKHEG